MDADNSTLPFADLEAHAQLTPKHPALAVLLSSFAVATVWGNTLVILAVICRQNLHTPTGYLVLSLAVADLIVGLGVMPLNVVFEMYDHVWLFSLAACDLWHSLDVLASTSSIWNLCVIAVDRCLAVTDPLNYPELISVHRVGACIAVVWIGSALISFPAVAWWRTASPELYVRSDRCPFTDDTGYLVFSSLLSFYVPLLIIVGAYGRVYTIASKHQQSLLEGRQPLPCNPSIYIRVHRGGRNTSTTSSPVSNNNSLISDQTSIQTISSTKTATSLISCHQSLPSSWPNQTDSSGQPATVSMATALRKVSRHNYGSYQNLPPPLISTNSSPIPTTASSSTRTSRSDSAFSYHSRRSRISLGSSMDSSSLGESKRRRKPRPSLLLRLLAKESKAAKTLGIVVGKSFGVTSLCAILMQVPFSGAFIACWLPFFVVNVLSGACGERCYFNSNSGGFRLTFTVVTWLGHCNSFLNPIIYTCFNREFRDAFAYVLFCGRWTRRGRAYARRRQLHRQLTTTGEQSFCAKKGLAKAIEGGLRVIVPQATNAEAVVISTNVTLTEEREIEDDGTALDTTSDQDRVM